MGFYTNPLPWPEAEAAFLSRVAMPAADFYALAEEYRAAAWTAMKITNMRTMLRAKRKLQQVIVNGETIESFRDWLKADALVWSSAYSEVVFRMAVLGGYSRGRYEEVMDPDIVDEFVYLFYDAVNDAVVREDHAAMDGRAWTRDDFPQEWWPPNGFNCFTGETAVSGNIEAVYRQRYSGEIIELKTGRDGDAVTRVTPNHPVLTIDGWVHAGKLKPGDQLVGDQSGGIKAVPVTCIHDNSEPVAIAEVFELALNLPDSILSVERACAEDFHGDSALCDGEVDIVRVNGILRVGDLSESIESNADLDLANSDSFVPGAGPCYCVGCSALNTHVPDCVVRAADTDRSSSTAEIYELLRTCAAAYNPEFIKPTADGSARYTVESLKLGHALLLGNVLMHEVVSVDRVPFSGHIYNLQTADGFYSANNIISHNCRCEVRTVTKAMAGKIGADIQQGTNATPTPDKGFNHNPNTHFGVDLSAVERQARADLQV